MHGVLYYRLNEPEKLESQKLQVLRSTAKVEAQLHLPAQGPSGGGFTVCGAGDVFGLAS